MGDEKTAEMTPNDDGTKIIADNYTDQKFAVITKNGDTKIDMGKTPATSGLTKEELMKYANDPFWVRLRWTLFILFWLCWLGMLVAAIVVIVRAPGCEPPPELKWVQESPIIEIDPTEPLPSEFELIEQCRSQGATSVFFPAFVSEDDYFESKYPDVQPLIDALHLENIGSIAELPVSMSRSNPLYQNFTEEGFLTPTGELNYDSEGLAKAMYYNFVEYWIRFGVKGFLLRDSSTMEIDAFVENLNSLMEEKEGAIGNDIKDVTSEVAAPKFDVDRLKAFLEEETGNWSYYQFNPSYHAMDGSLTRDEVRLMDIALYLFPATPMIPFGDRENETDVLLTGLADMRGQDGIKFGETYFANVSSNVVGFTRVYKGTPAYAVALNFGADNETVNFTGTNSIADSGTVELYSTQHESNFKTRVKEDLTDIMLSPYEGKVMQFVANFD